MTAYAVAQGLCRRTVSAVGRVGCADGGQEPVPCGHASRKPIASRSIMAGVSDHEHTVVAYRSFAMPRRQIGGGPEASFGQAAQETDSRHRHVGEPVILCGIARDGRIDARECLSERRTLGRCRQTAAGSHRDPCGRRDRPRARCTRRYSDNAGAGQSAFDRCYRTGGAGATNARGGIRCARQEVALPRTVRHMHATVVTIRQQAQSRFDFRQAISRRRARHADNQFAIRYRERVGQDRSVQPPGQAAKARPWLDHERANLEHARHRGLISRAAADDIVRPRGHDHAVLAFGEQRRNMLCTAAGMP